MLTQNTDFLSNYRKSIQNYMDLSSKKATKKLKYYLMKYWINDRLYRPPSDKYTAGLRYNSLKQHFKNMQKDNVD